jgi:fructose-1,6-bisphosphatase class II
VIAATERGNFLHAPDTYMEKIACGPGARGAISLQKSVSQNLKDVATALGKPLSHLTVVILARPRHEKIIAEVRELGARIRLIQDGDVSAGIATCWEDTGIDLLLGIGGAPEGVITAAAIKCMGGDFQGRLKYRNDDERKRASGMGVRDLDAIFKLEDLVRGPCLFCATGITDGPLLEGVRTLPGHFVSTQSIVMRSQTGTIRKIETMHNLNVKPVSGHEI